MKILVTGTPGTGKTTFCKALSKKLGILHHDLSQIIKNEKLGKQKTDCVVFNPKKLRKKFKDLDGILDTHCTDIITDPDIVILLRCSIEELINVYQKRSYLEQKIKQNIEYEIFNVSEEKFEADLIFYRENTSLDKMITQTVNFISNWKKGHSSFKKLDKTEEKEELDQILEFLKKKSEVKSDYLNGNK